MRTILFFLLTVLPLLPVSGQEKGTVSVPPYPMEKSVSAPFAGFIGDRLVVAGGCNFPDIPAAEGGKKAFYDTAYALDIRHIADGWKALPPLPAPMAYGAAATTPQGMVCIGGQNDRGPQCEAYLLKADGKTTPLPDLPTPIDNGGATFSRTTVYVTGGNQPGNAKGLYALDLAPDVPKAWKRLSDYPGPQRVQPIVLSTDESLFLIGGYAFDATRKVCTLSTDMLQYDFASDTWTRLDTLAAEADGTPRCLAGGSGIATDGKLILTGGVNSSIFRQAMEGKAPADYMKKPEEWYRFNDDLLMYDLRSGTWEITRDVPGMARAGGVLLYRDGCLYMVCGEAKPGIRSPQITVFQP